MLGMFFTQSVIACCSSHFRKQGTAHPFIVTAVSRELEHNPERFDNLRGQMEVSEVTILQNALSAMTSGTRQLVVRFEVCSVLIVHHRIYFMGANLQTHIEPFSAL